MGARLAPRALDAAGDSWFRWAFRLHTEGAPEELIVINFNGALHLALHQVRSKLGGSETLARTQFSTALRRAAGGNGGGQVPAPPQWLAVLRTEAAYSTTSSRANLALAVDVMRALGLMGKLPPPLKTSFERLFTHHARSAEERAIAAAAAAAAPARTPQPQQQQQHMQPPPSAAQPQLQVAPRPPLQVAPRPPLRVAAAPVASYSVSQPRQAFAPRLVGQLTLPAPSRAPGSMLPCRRPAESAPPERPAAKRRWLDFAYPRAAPSVQHAQQHAARPELHAPSSAAAAAASSMPQPEQPPPPAPRVLPALSAAAAAAGAQPPAHEGAREVGVVSGSSTAGCASRSPRVADLSPA